MPSSNTAAAAAPSWATSGRGEDHAEDAEGDDAEQGRGGGLGGERRSLFQAQHHQDRSGHDWQGDQDPGHLRTPTPPGQGRADHQERGEHHLEH